MACELRSLLIYVCNCYSITVIWSDLVLLCAVFSHIVVVWLCVVHVVCKHLGKFHYLDDFLAKIDTYSQTSLP